jgi:hypothetical protein
VLFADVFGNVLVNPRNFTHCVDEQ